MLYEYNLLMEEAGDVSGGGGGAVDGAGAVAPQDWTSTLSDENKSYLTNKGFKDPGSILESYRNLEKLQGVPQERLLKLPEDMSSDEAQAIWERLGKPKEADGYQFEIPEEIGDKEFTKWAKETAHSLGMPRNQAEGFMKALIERAQNDLKTKQEERSHAATQEESALKKEWGAAFEQNKNIAEDAARNLGISSDEASALGAILGPKKSMEMLLKLGKATGEAEFRAGNKSDNTLLEPVNAQQEISALKSDIDFIAKLRSGDTTAKARWNRLHAQAFPGEISI